MSIHMASWPRGKVCEETRWGNACDVCNLCAKTEKKGLGDGFNIPVLIVSSDQSGPAPS